LSTALTAATNNIAVSVCLILYVMVFVISLYHHHHHRIVVIINEVQWRRKYSLTKYAIAIKCLKHTKLNC